MWIRLEMMKFPWTRYHHQNGVFVMKTCCQHGLELLPFPICPISSLYNFFAITLTLHFRNQIFNNWNNVILWALNCIITSNILWMSSNITTHLIKIKRKILWNCCRETASKITKTELLESQCLCMCRSGVIPFGVWSNLRVFSFNSNFIGLHCNENIRIYQQQSFLIWLKISLRIYRSDTAWFACLFGIMACFWILLTKLLLFVISLYLCSFQIGLRFVHCDFLYFYSSSLWHPPRAPKSHSKKLHGELYVAMSVRNQNSIW